MARPWHNTRRLIGPALAPFYRLAVAQRNAKFDRGQGVRRVPLPVISVGNLTTGGTGKTPMVMLICRELLAMGRRPAIAMRGYKADAAGNSDEADEYRRELPEVPVIIGGDRHAAVTACLKQAEAKATPAPDCIVLDDGFQHRQLHRDLDIVLVHADVDLLTERPLPTGDLREPLTSLSRAGLVVLTHAAESRQAIEAGTHWTCRLPPGLPRPIVLTQHIWASLRGQASGDLPIESLGTTPTLAVCAIGNPQAFFAAARKVCKLTGTVALPDHDAFGAAAVTRIRTAIAAAGAKAMLVTEKDWSKISRLPPDTFSIPIYRPKLALEVLSGREVLTSKLRECTLTPGRQP